MTYLHAEIGVMLRGRPDREQQVPRVAGGEAPFINPALEDGGLFIDKLFQFALQEVADMRCAGQHFIGKET